jgi:predicted heme/steroid binding protein
MPEFSKEELAENNGKGGNPIWIAYKGNIYDVTASPLWAEGEHQGMHVPGQDLSFYLESMAPHGTEVLERYPKIGTLASG